MISSILATFAIGVNLSAVQIDPKDAFKKLESLYTMLDVWAKGQETKIRARKLLPKMRLLTADISSLRVYSRALNSEISKKSYDFESVLEAANAVSTRLYTCNRRFMEIREKLFDFGPVLSESGSLMFEDFGSRMQQFQVLEKILIIKMDREPPGSGSWIEKYATEDNRKSLTKNIVQARVVCRNLYDLARRLEKRSTDSIEKLSRKIGA